MSSEFRETCVFNARLPEGISYLESVNWRDINDVGEQRDEISANDNNPPNENDSLKPPTVQPVRRPGIFREPSHRLGYEHTFWMKRMRTFPKYLSCMNLLRIEKQLPI